MSADARTPPTGACGESHGEEDVDLEQEGASSEDDIGWELSGEALDALEESLKQQYDTLVKEHKEFEDMIGKATSMAETQSEKLLRDIEAMKKEINLISEDVTEEIDARDQSLSDLRNVEQAHADVNRKYARGMQALEKAKAAEDALKEEEAKLTEAILSTEGQLEVAKKAAKERIQIHYKDAVAKETDLVSENVTVAAMLRRSEMRLETLENDLKQSKEENAILNQLSDDLIERNAAAVKSKRRNP